MEKFIFPALQNSFVKFSLCILALTAFVSHNVSAQQIPLTACGTAYTQDFNTFLGTGLTFPAGWTATFTGTATYAGTDAGAANSGGVRAYGVAASGEYALGALRSGTSGNISHTATFVNNTGQTITTLTIAYNFEQWRYGGSNTTGFVVTQTGLGAASVAGLSQAGVNLTPAGAVSPPLSTPKSLVLSGLSVPPCGTFTLTWTTDDAAGSENGVGVDDFSITPSSCVQNQTQVAAVTGSPFCLPAAGSPISLSFSLPNATAAFLTTNTFTAQLSDASGSFASPTTIGTLSGAAAGTIAGTLPSGTADGIGYRIRVISSCASIPAASYLDNGTNIIIANQPVISSAVSSCVTGAGSGRITVTATGSNLQYALNAGAYQASNVFNSLPDGTYSVTVRTSIAPACSATQSALVLNCSCTAGAGTFPW